MICIISRRLLVCGKLAFIVALITTLLLMLDTSNQARSAVAAPVSPATVTIPSMKLPWDKSLTNIPLTGGPHSGKSQTPCILESISSMSGVDFGLPYGTNVLAVAAGTVFLAKAVSDSRGPYIVGIDHKGNFATEYWHLSSINSSINVGVSVNQGTILAKSGAPVNPPGPAHLHLEFRTGSPGYLTPLSAHKMPIDGYTIWTYVRTSNGDGYNYQGTMTRGTTINKSISACSATGVKTWYSQSGSTIIADANGTGGYLTSTNSSSGQNVWNIVPSPSVPAGSALKGIVALSDNDAWAVGSQSNQMLIEHWNGTQWSIVSSPTISGGCYNSLESVATISSTSVWAVGACTGSTLIEHWNGVQWSIVPSPSPYVDNVLTAVTAISDSDVWAIGYGANGSGSLTEHWDGTSWTVVPSPEPNSGPGASNELYGVAAISTSDVWAVGETGITRYTQGFLLHWDGTSWNVVSSPTPPNSSATSLEAVTALSTNNVWAVGINYLSSGSVTEGTLMEHWDGVSWSIVSSPNRDVFNDLYGVTALSSTNIWAVGYSTASYAPEVTLIEQWNGTSWNIVSSPNADTDNELHAATSVSDGRVWAVGYSFSSTTAASPLIEQYG